MTHVWQWNGNGQAPKGLIEGIADFVRLKAGYVPSHWVKPGQGNQWDQGYDVMAQLLDYCKQPEKWICGSTQQEDENWLQQQIFCGVAGEDSGSALERL